MTTALLFPGQGSQTPEMGREFYEAWPEARERLDRLSAAFDPPGDGDADLRTLAFDAPAERLRRTENAQPAVYAVGLAVAGALAERYEFDVDLVAGHSLGHVTAAAHAGVFGPVDGLGLVAERGRAMARAARADGPGRMVAVLLADPVVVREACAAVEGASVAAYNTDRQTVVSGTDEAVGAVEERVTERGARTRDLDVAAAFHSSVMERAVDPVGEALSATPAARATTPVVSDLTGEPYLDPSTAVADLAAQVRSPVDWVAVTRTLETAGVERFVELPPAGTLARFVERTVGDATVIPLETPADAEDLV